jgi:hemolysin activation/secretion protein
MHYKLGKEFESLDSSGNANITQVLVTHPLLRSRFRNLQLRAGYDDKRYDNSAKDVQISDKLVRNVTVGLSLNMQDDVGGGGLLSASVDATRGDVDLSRNAAFAAGDAAGPGTAGKFTRFNYQVSRIQALVPGVTLLASVGGQLASGNLESGEKMSLGGAGRVRAYPAGEASGDAGHVVTVETHWDVPAYKLDLSVFYDAGRVTLVRSPYPGALAAGAANGDDSDGTSSRTRAWVQIARYF